MRLAFQLVLRVVAAIMVIASRVHPRIRRQLSRDLTVTIASDDGARQHFVIHDRRIDAPRHVQRSDVTLHFARSLDGIRALLHPRTAGKIVQGMNDGSIRVDGNAVLILWFHGLTRVVLPIGRTRVPYRPIPAPVRGIETEAAWASVITREPAVDELDREWRGAWAARASLVQLRGPNGDPLPPG